MKTGTCRRCELKTVVKRMDGIGAAECTSLYVDEATSNWITFETFLCFSCGYFENFVANEAHLKKIAHGTPNWKRVEG